MSNESIENRKKLVLAMEMIIRDIADEELIDAWLRDGVADGDIELFSTDIEEVDDCYISDETLEQLIKCFLNIMVVARVKGGLDLP